MMIESPNFSFLTVLGIAANKNLNHQIPLLFLLVAVFWMVWSLHQQRKKKGVSD